MAMLLDFTGGVRFLVLFMIGTALVGLLAWLGTAALRKASKRWALSRFGKMTLSDLQREAPRWTPELSITSTTLFRPKDMAWFEALLAKLCSERGDRAQNLNLVNEQYVAILAGVRDYLAQVWSKAWHAAKPGDSVTLTAGGNLEANSLDNVQKALKWLSRLASEHCSREQAGNAPRVVWDLELLRADTSVDAKGRLILTLRATPAALESEIARLVKPAG
jgi:hypothetical protein